MPDVSFYLLSFAMQFVSFLDFAVWIFAYRFAIHSLMISHSDFLVMLSFFEQFQLQRS